MLSLDVTAAVALALCFLVHLPLDRHELRCGGGEMGNKTPKLFPEKRPPVAVGKIRICVLGFQSSHHTNRAGQLTRLIVSTFPNQYESWFHFDSPGYRTSLEQIKKQLPESQQSSFSQHHSSPFCWLEFPDKEIQGIGGRDRLCEWAISQFPQDTKITEFASQSPSLLEIFVDETPGTSQQEIDK
jgi:hypothetical protein